MIEISRELNVVKNEKIKFKQKGIPITIFKKSEDGVVKDAFVRFGTDTNFWDITIDQIDSYIILLQRAKEEIK